METHLYIYIFFTSLSMHGIEEEREATFGKKFVKVNCELECHLPKLISNIGLLK